MTEKKLQEAIITFYTLQANKRPELMGLLFEVNNNPYNRVHGWSRKKIGMVAGVADLIWFSPKGPVAIELKTKTGQQTLKQKKWENQISRFGYRYQLIRSAGEFVNLFNELAMPFDLK